MSELLERKVSRIHKDVWKAIKEGYESGVPIPDLASRYGVRENTIEVKAHVKNWTNAPRKIISEVKRAALEEAEMILSSEKSIALPREVDWVDAALNYRTMIFGKVNQALRETVAEPPKTWRDIEIADRIARKAVGLESGETAVVQTIIPIGKGDFNVERDVSPSRDVG